MRVLLAVIAVLGGLGLFVGGLMFALVGFADQRVADHVYVVAYKHSGDDCGPGRVTFDLEDGAPLGCSPVPLTEVNVNLPGFSKAQNGDLESLAAELGAGGLSAAEQQQIQGLVDRYAAGVPAEERPYPAEAYISLYGIWGARLGWLGVGMLGAAVAIAIVLHRG
jgi:hypothetical protein